MHSALQHSDLWTRTAFKNLSLYKYLIMNWEALSIKDICIGNIAYLLKSFLLTPYDGVTYGTTEDSSITFTYHHKFLLSVHLAK